LVPVPFDRAEGVLDEALAELDLLGVSTDAFGHVFEDGFVDPAGNAPVATAAGAARFEGTGATGGGRVDAVVASCFLGFEVEGKDFSGRAEVAVLGGVVVEVLLAKEAQGAVG
jgi:hypothetical protein